MRRRRDRGLGVEPARLRRRAMEGARAMEHRVRSSVCSLSLGGPVAEDSVRRGRVARVGFTGRGGRRRASLSGRGSRSRFLVEIDDGGGKGAVLRQDCEAQRCEHEHESCHDRKLAEKVCRTSAAEDRLTRSAERGADFRALAGLKENGADHERAHDDMDDDE